MLIFVVVILSTLVFVLYEVWVTGTIANILTYIVLSELLTLAALCGNFVFGSDGYMFIFLRVKAMLPPAVFWCRITFKIRNTSFVVFMTLYKVPLVICLCLLSSRNKDLSEFCFFFTSLVSLFMFTTRSLREVFLFSSSNIFAICIVAARENLGIGIGMALSYCFYVGATLNTSSRDALSGRVLTAIVFASLPIYFVFMLKVIISVSLVGPVIFVLLILLALSGYAYLWLLTNWTFHNLSVTVLSSSISFMFFLFLVFKISVKSTWDCKSRSNNFEIMFYVCRAFVYFGVLRGMCPIFCVLLLCLGMVSALVDVGLLTVFWPSYVLCIIFVSGLIVITTWFCTLFKFPMVVFSFGSWICFLFLCVWASPIHASLPIAGVVLRWHTLLCSWTLAPMFIIFLLLVYLLFIVTFSLSEPTSLRSFFGSAL